MTDRELMQQALEALEEACEIVGAAWAWRNEKGRPAITALRERLAQQEQVASEHITDGRPCWCEPETNYKDPETGISVIVHKEPQ